MSGSGPQLYETSVMSVLLRWPRNNPTQSILFMPDGNGGMLAYDITDQCPPKWTCPPDLNCIAINDNRKVTSTTFPLGPTSAIAIDENGYIAGGCLPEGLARTRWNEIGRN